MLGLSGPTVVYLMVWLALMNSLQPAIIGQENVELFPAKILAEYLPAWNLQWATEDAVNFGFPVHRIRQLCTLGHKEKTVNPDLMAPLANWFREFHRSRTPACTHEIFVHAKADDVKNMYDEANKSKKKCNGVAFDQADFDWTKLLAPGHAKALKTYRKAFPKQAYSLGQEPANGFSANSADGVLQTIIRNCRPLWLDFLPNPRPATGLELLGTQGVVVPASMRLALCDQQPVCPFDLPNPQRSEASKCAQAGNGMNIEVAALLSLFLLLTKLLNPAPAAPALPGEHL